MPRKIDSEHGADGGHLWSFRDRIWWKIAVMDDLSENAFTCMYDDGCASMCRSRIKSVS